MRASETRVTWTEELRQKIHFGHGIDVPKSDKGLQRARLRRDIVQQFRLIHEKWASALEGPRETLDRLESLRERLFSTSRKRKQAPLDPDEEAISSALLAQEFLWKQKTVLHKLMQFWVASEGAAFAVDALCRSWSYDVRYGQAESIDGTLVWHRNPELLCLESPDLSALSRAVDFEKPVPLALKTLRETLALVEEHEYRAARDRAAALRPAQPLLPRLVLDYLFPAETNWAGADLTELARQPERPLFSAPLLGSLGDPESAITLLELLPSRESVKLAVQLAPTLLVRLGADALEPLAAFLGIEHGDSCESEIFALLARIESPDVALFFAEVVDQLSQWIRPTIFEFFTRLPHLSEPVLRQALEQGAGGDGVKMALEQVHRAHPELAGEASPAVRPDEVPEVLESPRDKTPLPRFIKNHELVEVTLTKSGNKLPLAALVRLVELIRAPEGQDKDAIRAVRKACDPASLEAFAWQLFGAWEEFRWPKAEKWTLRGLALFASDETARRLPPILARFPGQSLFAHAVTGLEVLERIGSDAALLSLAHLANKAKSKGLRGKAEEKLQQIARKRGLAGEQLADRVVPDLGLNEDGEMILDFGRRQFHVGLDEQLLPFVTDSAGNTLKSLPRPGAKDDAAKSKAAQKAWKELRADLKSLRSGLLKRLERAMCQQRLWSLEELQQHLLRHRLMLHLSRRLVWGIYSRAGALQGTFWVVPGGGGCGNVTGQEAILSSEALYGVVHPLRLTPALLGEWSRRFSEVGLEQPFEQLARAVYRPGDAATEAVLEAVPGTEVKSGVIRGLTGERWDRGVVEDNGVYFSIARRAPNGVIGRLRFTGGVNVTGSYGSDEVTLTELELPPHPAETADFSEMLRELAALVGTSSVPT